MRGELRIVVDFVEGADPAAIRMLATELEGWTRGRALIYGAQTPRVEGRRDRLREAIEEHRQQGLRDSVDEGDALDYVARSQRRDATLYAALTDNHREGSDG